MLTDEQIKSFQLLWENRFGKKIGREEAYEKGAKLVRLIELIYRPMTESEYQKLQERRKQTGDYLEIRRQQPRCQKLKNASGGSKVIGGDNQRPAVTD